MRTHLIVSDVQSPYHDQGAIDVFLQIGQHIKPDTLVINGDFGDFRSISKYPTRFDRGRLVSELSEEIERCRTLLELITKSIKCRRRLWNDGNHEWRVFRSMSQLPQGLQLLGVGPISSALSMPEMLDLNKLGFVYAGEYPHGQWLVDAKDKEKNVWVEHGYLIRNKGGYLAQGLIDKRLCNVVVGHGERLAINWRNAVGNRSYFGVEGGNMSIIGVPGRGDGIYSTSPLNVADYRDSQQGFVVIYEDAGVFYPYVVRIKDGRAVWDGKLYKG